MPPPEPRVLDHPYHFDGLGRTAGTGAGDHVRDLIEQVLFTSPGERVMRPDFGAGLLALVFEPGSSTLAATTQFLVQSALQQQLADRIAVQGVQVAQTDSALQVSVTYSVLGDASGNGSGVQQAQFNLPASSFGGGGA
jgi:phage baseplate assembly protein W